MRSRLRRDSQSSEILDHAQGVTALYLTHSPSPLLCINKILNIECSNF